MNFFSLHSLAKCELPGWSPFAILFKFCWPACLILFVQTLAKSFMLSRAMLPRAVQ